MGRAKVIVLNGTSSSGKSSIARELQTLLAEPYLHLGVDAFIDMLPARYFGDQPPADEGFRLVKRADGTDIHTGPIAQRLLRGMYDCFTALAAAGNHLIIDHVILDREGLADLVEAVADFEALFVGVRCPLEVLLQRESARPDRAPGMARAQYPVVHAHCIYDLEIDTSLQTPSAAAAQIKRRREDGPAPAACRQMRQLFAERRSDQNIQGVVETGIYVDDLDRAEVFYRDVLGLAVIARERGRHAFFRVGERNVLLAFLPAATLKGDALPAHGASGPGHFALGIAACDLDVWRQRLTAHHVAIEKAVHWPRGGQSLYFRDPAGNSVELITPGCWGLPSGW
jgi:chloramphenicol 3-O-phosphotransferase/catechol 2,3-dioxygenase-like lactoylglutathione lyase family enzyme